METTVNVEELRARVQAVYREVAEDPHAGFHFEVGRALAERLGYSPELLNRVAPEAVDSFAGVGCPFLVADIDLGESVLDLGSGSGMDACVAALLAGPSGSVTGVDMTEAQLEKARRASGVAGLRNVTYLEGYIESLPVESGRTDVVTSNGVINLAAQKRLVFAEVYRVLKPGGRMAIADIVSESALTENIVCDAALWAACIGGAAQQDDYLAMIEESGLKVVEVRENDEYRFLSKSALNASRDYGVKSVTIRAEKAA
jgi:arsenite methyltransferase